MCVCLYAYGSAGVRVCAVHHPLESIQSFLQFDLYKAGCAAVSLLFLPLSVSVCVPESSFAVVLVACRILISIEIKIGYQKDAETWKLGTYKCSRPAHRSCCLPGLAACRWAKGSDSIKTAPTTTKQRSLFLRRFVCGSRVQPHIHRRQVKTSSWLGSRDPHGTKMF